MFDSGSINDGNCYFPVFSMNPPNLDDGTEESRLNSLNEEKLTWYLGTIFFEKYFMVFDDSPYQRAVSEKKEDLINYNYVGIANCDSHGDHVDLYND